jgi:hypothetical protein
MDCYMTCLVAMPCWLAANSKATRRCWPTCINNRIVDLPLIAPVLVHSKGAGLKMAWKLEWALLARSVSCIVSLSIHVQQTRRLWIGSSPVGVYHTIDKEPEQADTIPEIAGKPGFNLNEIENTVKELNATRNRNGFNLMKLDGKAITRLKPNKTN